MSVLSLRRFLARDHERLPGLDVRLPESDISYMKNPEYFRSDRWMKQNEQANWSDVMAHVAVVAATVCVICKREAVPVFVSVAAPTLDAPDDIRARWAGDTVRLEFAAGIPHFHHVAWLAELCEAVAVVLDEAVYVTVNGWSVSIHSQFADDVLPPQGGTQHLTPMGVLASLRKSPRAYV